MTSFCRSTLIPERRAASSLPPMAYIARPEYVRLRMNQSTSPRTTMTSTGTGSQPPMVRPSQATCSGWTIGGWLPVPVLVMVVLGLVAWFILNRTYSGRAMYAIGGNEEAARLSGINVDRQKLVIYSLAGLYSAVAGLVLAGRLASGQPQAAAGYELDAIAAVVIGGASLAGGSGRAFGTSVGALVLAVIRNGLNLLNVSSFWQQVVIGAVIALAVLSDTLRRRRG